MPRRSPTESAERFRLPWVEAISWAIAVGFFWGLDTLTKLDVRARTGVGLEDVRLYTEQATSAVAALTMVTFVVGWLRWFPPSRQRPSVTIAGHLVGSALFGAGHYTLMVGLRTLVYAVLGRLYTPGPWLPNAWFEYKKDVKIYLTLVGIIVAYRALRELRSAAAATSKPGRLEVQTTRGRRFVPLEGVDYFEAARNYVRVHCAGERFTVRSSLSALEKRLRGQPFLRIHRSFLVRDGAIVGIDRGGTGWSLELVRGQRVPVSRTYRESVAERLTALSL